MVKIIILFLISNFPILLFAQNLIFGTISDGETGEELPFSSVINLSTNDGTVANMDADFQLVADINDTIKITHVGYQTLLISAIEIQQSNVIKLYPSTLNLNAVEITDRDLTALEIIERVNKSYETNHPNVNQTLEIFYHRFEKSGFPKTNKFEVKESDFVGLDISTINNLLKYMPKEFVEYQDGFLKWHTYQKEHKVQLEEGISLQEQSVNQLEDLVKGKLETFFDDVKTTQTTDDLYYKFRTGVFSFKPETSSDSIFSTFEKDSSLYPVPTRDIKYSIESLLEHFTTIGGRNLEFFKDTKHYDYGKPTIEVLNDELVYQINFSSKDKGLFTGTMYIAKTDFSILQLQMEFTEGKSSSEFQMFGIGHATNFKSALVIYERTSEGCFPKYLNVNIKETATINRDFSVMKKEKRFMWDKTLNELKMAAELEFYPDNHYEILIQKRTPLSKVKFESITEERIFMFKKSLTQDLSQIGNKTAITPTEDLKKYVRSE